GIAAAQQQYQSVPSYAEIVAALAQIYVNKTYIENSQIEDKWAYRTAYEYCQQGIKAFPKSYGADICRNLQAQILRKELSMNAERVVPADQPILAKINYRNLNKLFTKVVRLTAKDKEKYEGLNYEDRLPFLNKLEVLQTATYDLPDDGDYRNHSAEIKIDPLPFGKYFFLSSDTQQFTDQKHAVSIVEFDVSNLIYMTRQLKNARSQLIVVDRVSGAPLAGVEAAFLQRDYNSRKRIYQYKVVKTGTTDQQGMIQTALPERGYYQLRLTKGEDLLQLDNNLNAYYNDREVKEQGVVNFFLDRGIYRPGQTIYFKGVAYRKDSKQMPSIIKSETIKVELRDANYQVVGSKELKTNEYGTFNGSFIAPTSGLLGRMNLIATSARWNDMGNSGFRVEEYKRPKFEVTFQPVEGSFRLSDEVVVKGDAKAFAGSNVDGAKVSYRVVRETIYPYWSYWLWRRYPPQGKSVEIVNGETTTDAQGGFEIKFTAQPDASTDPKNKPQFNYRIYADVVDITGETQSAEQSVAVGYIALSVNVPLKEQLNADSLKSIRINTENLNGVFEAAEGKVVIEELKAPDRVLQNRLWTKPDKTLMSRGEFESAFPHIAYENEDEISGWPVLREVQSTVFNTAEAKTVAFQQAAYTPGQYMLTLTTKDKFGEAIELKKYFKVYDLDATRPPANAADWFVTERTLYEPGETAKAYQASAFENIHLLVGVEKDNDLVRQNWSTLNALTTLQFPVQEGDRGGFFVHRSFVKNSRLYTSTQRVEVPWSNKELTVEYQTFRNKLYPGQDEEWRLKISGPKKEKVAAEMVATMYDASLDQFVQHSWNFGPFPGNYYAQRTLNGNGLGQANSYNRSDDWQPQGVSISRRYRRLINMQPQYLYRERALAKSSMRTDATMSAPAEPAPNVASDQSIETTELEEISVAGDVSPPPPPPPGEQNDDDSEDLSNVKVRTNLDETVFFLPDLRTDAEGNVLIKFKMNEALTRWKFLGFAHTPELQYALTEKEIVTQKDLMVLPNPPRFFREGDEIEFTAKVSNLTKVDMNGTAQLQLFDAVSMQPVDVLLENENNQQSFTAKAGQSARLAWRLTIPKGEVMALTHRVVAKAGNFSDGEESSLPILTNRMLVTETQPLSVRGGEQKAFTFQSLKNAGQSSTLDHHKYTLEFTSNPAWYAVQALPYMMEYPYECTEQIFNRLYANSLAAGVANSHPKIKRVFDQWKTMDTDALESNLSKNQELKTALLEETPWVLAAQSEAEQKKNIGLLFDLNTMSAQADKAIGQLVERQLGNGGFAWFPGGRDSWYITQYLVEGMGHLDKLGVMSSNNDERLVQLSNNAVRYIDERLVEHYEDLKKRVKRNKGKMQDDHLSSMAIHYLYARSFFPNVSQASAKLQEASNYYLAQAKKYWLGKGIYQEGMIALALSRNGETTSVNDILKSLKERAQQHEELGMYWNYNRGYYWYQAPIETQALMIELFEEVAKDAKAVDDLKIWLLKNKQTTHWKTTKATSAAVYALLMNGDNWLMSDADINIDIAGQRLDQSRLQKEAGTGYFKTSWSDKEIEPDMAEVTVENPNNSVAWGAAYWQYFEDLEKIKTFEETPLTL
ncbi:MAG: alpha-2-macroglobulin family protein, partial [Bacteroidota bacterium]